MSRRLACVASCVMALGSLPAPGQVVISQVYGGGGNTGATYRQDFIELHNNTNAPIPVNGWSVQYASVAGSTWQMTALNGVIPPGAYYLIQEAQGAGGTINIPSPQAVGTIPMSANAGKVALVTNTTLLTGSCPLGSSVVDFVGYGGANCFEGAGPAPTLTSTTAAVRLGNGCMDVGNNTADFTATAPNPRNAGTAGFICPPTLLSRAQATSVLLSPGSGVPIDLNVSNIWSPFELTGMPPGYEGLYPPETRIDVPAASGQTGMLVTVPSYFFWIDDLPTGQFAHPCRFVLVNATMPNPSVSNGGILINPVDWWPVITTPGMPSGVDHFRLLVDIATSAPAGSTNPQGLIGGQTHTVADVVPPPAPGPAGTDASRHGIILIGDGREDFQGDDARHQADLKARSRVPAANVNKHGVGVALTKQQFCDAIDNHVMALMTLAMNGMPPSRIYVRISTHGTPASDPRGRGITVNNGTEHITAAELCAKLRKYAKFGVPVHIVFNSCFSGGLADASAWDLPAGSTVICSADGSHSSFGGPYRDGMTPFTGSTFQYGLTKCGMDNRADTNGDHEVDDCEAFVWLTTERPCYTWPGDGTMNYPGGRPVGAHEDVPDPNANKRIVGVSSKTMNYNAKNMTGGAKTDFHILFKGDVRGGVGRSWHSNAGDMISDPWDGDPMITYDPTTDTTMVCYENTSAPIANGSYVHFGYFSAPGNLRVVKQWWTPTPDPPANADKAPAAGTSMYHNTMNDTVVVRIFNRTTGVDGWGEPIFIAPMYWTSPIDIELVQLNLVSVNSMLGSGTPLSSPMSLQPDGAVEFTLEPGVVPPGQFLIVGVNTAWALNANTVNQLELFPAMPLPPCIADVDDGSFTGTRDGGVTIDDLLYYLFIFEAGAITADVDDGSFTGTLDGGVTIDDLLYYLFRFEAGC